MNEWMNEWMNKWIMSAILLVYQDCLKKKDEQ